MRFQNLNSGQRVKNGTFWALFGGFSSLFSSFLSFYVDLMHVRFQFCKKISPIALLCKYTNLKDTAGQSARMRGPFPVCIKDPVFCQWYSPPAHIQLTIFFICICIYNWVCIRNSVLSARLFTRPHLLDHWLRVCEAAFWSALIAAVLAPSQLLHGDDDDDDDDDPPW